MSGSVDSGAMSPRVVRVRTENNHYQRAETLRRNRAARRRGGEFFVEGVRSINQALAHGWTINAFIYTRERPLSDWATNILRDSTAAAHLELAAPMMDKLSGKTDPSERLALVATPP
ncbi:MAG: hypothetical protein WKH64_10150, partial [Chloroflexia bacterium]